MRTVLLLLIPAMFLVAIGGGTYVLRQAPTIRPACVVDACPFEIHEEDANGKFTYRLTSRFTLILDETKHPADQLAVVCTPEHVIGSISNVPSVQKPLYAARFEGVLAGSCLISNGDFSAVVRIVASD